ncbi:MAG: SH3 domain-containing protein, partial [Acidobacteriota bacterium]|nr:SH3 domain-containing protein [Acidobacteriota bacterium]
MRKISRIKFLIFAVLTAFAVVLAAETLIVKVQTTNLRKEPKFYSQTVAVLKAGEMVEKISTYDGWYKVRTLKGVEGWLHSSSVSEKRFSLLAVDKSLQTTASVDEVALASKGFNKQVEKKYKEDHGEISFVWVDKMIKFKVTAEQLRKFLKKGKLGEFGGAK